MTPGITPDELMRVDYTLPGFLPPESAVADATEVLTSPFRARLSVLPTPRGPNWESLLRINVPPVNATSIGPPPRPPALETRDAAAERANWRQMLDRQLALLDDTPKTEDPTERAIERMLALLMGFREIEDSIAARYLAEPGE